MVAHDGTDGLPKGTDGPCLAGVARRSLTEEARPSWRHGQEVETDVTETGPAELDERAAFRRRIAQAVLAYGQWRLDLYRAVESGAVPLPAGLTESDDRCAFGRWLRHGLTAADRRGPDYRRVRRLHAAFHALAAGIVELASAGRREEALAAMAPDSGYGRASSRFTLALMAWLAALRPLDR